MNLCTQVDDRRIENALRAAEAAKAREFRDVEHMKEMREEAARIKAQVCAT